MEWVILVLVVVSIGLALGWNKRKRRQLLAGTHESGAEAAGHEEAADESGKTADGRKTTVEEARESG